MKHHRLNELPEEPITRLFSRRFFTDDNITTAFLSSKEGCIVARHLQDGQQFSYCTGGALQFKIRGEEMVLRAGELVQIPSNAQHAAILIEDFTCMDVFSPIRSDWCDRMHSYLRQSNQAK